MALGIRLRFVCTLIFANVCYRRMEQTQSDHKDFLYYLIKQLENGSIGKDEVIVNGALMM